MGTFLALVARLGGQRIGTDASACVSCGACDRACPLDIAIASRAKEKLPVTSLRCVGCGHCVDACPKKTLRYETAFLRFASALRKRK